MRPQRHLVASGLVRNASHGLIMLVFISTYSRNCRRSSLLSIVGCRGASWEERHLWALTLNTCPMKIGAIFSLKFPKGWMAD